MLKQLILIIIEVIEDNFKQFQNINVSALSFNNTEELNQELKIAATSINGKYEILDIKNIDINKITDFLFIDEIPINYISQLALGIISDDLSKFINKMILESKTIFVLKKSDLENAPNTYKTLFEQYYNVLESYGFVFLNK